MRALEPFPSRINALVGAAELMEFAPHTGVERHKDPSGMDSLSDER
jgi:hypothetical protein